jgi:hypothetical protein
MAVCLLGICFSQAALAGNLSALPGLNLRTGISPDKIWTITFSGPVDMTTCDAVYITNSLGQEVGTYITEGSNSRSILVKPKENYLCAQTYYLNIGTGLKSTSGSRLQTELTMPFRIMSQGNKIGTYNIAYDTQFTQKFTVSGLNLSAARYFNLFRNGEPLSEMLLPPHNVRR